MILRYIASKPHGIIFESYIFTMKFVEIFCEIFEFYVDFSR